MVPITFIRGVSFASSRGVVTTQGCGNHLLGKLCSKIGRMLINHYETKIIYTTTVIIKFNKKIRYRRVASACDVICQESGVNWPHVCSNVVVSRPGLCLGLGLKTFFCRSLVSEPLSWSRRSRSCLGLGTLRFRKFGRPAETFKKKKQPFLKYLWVILRILKSSNTTKPKMKAWLISLFPGVYSIMAYVEQNMKLCFQENCI